jgi:hypothetical protein
VPSYWLVDPDALTVLVLELRHGVYAEVAVVGGDEVWQAQRPFPVSIAPARLLD